MPTAFGRVAAALVTVFLATAMAAAGGATYRGKSAQQWTEELSRESMDAFFALSAPEKEAAPVLGEMLAATSRACAPSPPRC